MISLPSKKYTAFAPVDLPDRQWPSKSIECAPIWMSTDLRDGNQALINPMSVETKLQFFSLLVDLGFKEIEVGFPSASQIDCDFVRKLIENSLIPDDVTIEVLTQARKELIDKTVESLSGAKRAIVHLYNPIAPVFRDVVYNTDKLGVKAIAQRGATWVQEAIKTQPQTEWTLEYSPEVFSSTELEFSKEVCDAVCDIWLPTLTQKTIINLPATVEMCTPNTYADQIEWMHNNLKYRDSIVLSVHPHNDRGTAVAAAELAVMAGADRVEGCLFGNGERTGNVDLVTLALNLYTQGVDPLLDLSNIDNVRQKVESFTELPVHPRHPYAGELVFTAFSGSHQDAIKKGMSARSKSHGVIEKWQVPYLPIDPMDLNRSYDAVIRVNSQSGKGGVSYLLQQAKAYELPRRLQLEFSKIVQKKSDESAKEIPANEIVSLFENEYFGQDQYFELVASQLIETKEKQSTIHIELKDKAEFHLLMGVAAGPLEAAVNALSPFIDKQIRVIDYHEHALSIGADSYAMCYVEIQVGDAPVKFGVGKEKSIVSAVIAALLSGLARSA